MSALSAPIEVFYSYADADEDLRIELDKHLSLLQRESIIAPWCKRLITAGQEWTQVIDQHLNTASVILLLISADFMASDYCYGIEMRHAMERHNSREAHVIPILLRPVDWHSAPFGKLKALPSDERPVTSWPNHDAAFEDIAQGIRAVLGYGVRRPVPFMVEDLPANFVQRPHEFESLIRCLLDKKREEPIAITAALRGAGGYGKTTMAMALCHDKRMREAFRDGILWVTLGEEPGDPVKKIEDWIYILNKERPGFASIQASSSYLATLLADRTMLLVIDDVWNSKQLHPFLQGGKNCTRLITTRDDSVLPPQAQRIPVDAMRPEEAVALLNQGLCDVPRSLRDTQYLRTLARKLGEWPLLLMLVNGVLYEQVHEYHKPLYKALAYVNQALEKYGLVAFDQKDVQERHQAVRATLSVSFELLGGDDYTHYRELAIFPEDINIPLLTVQKLWNATNKNKLDDIAMETFCMRLRRLSLLLDFDPIKCHLRLHDVIRSYLQQDLGTDALVTLHGQFLDVYGTQHWVELPDHEPYLWDHLADHLVAATRDEELVKTVLDLSYLAKKTWVRNTYAPVLDLLSAETQSPDTDSIRLLKHNITNMCHLLNACHTIDEVAVTLYSRLVHLDEIAELCEVLCQKLSRPFLMPWHMLPSLPDPSLIRTLQAHKCKVEGCAISPDNNWIVSASDDSTLKVWDARTGAELLTLEGHKGLVFGCAVSPLGDYIVSASGDKTLKVWDAQIGAELFTLQGHTGIVYACAVSPDNNWIVSASEDQTLKIWDAHTGIEQLTLYGHRSKVRGCAVSPSGEWVVSASEDKTLKVWDAHTGTVRMTLEGHSGDVYSCAVSPSGKWIVSSSWDRTLKVWDAHTGKEQLTLKGHKAIVFGCAISPAGDSIISAGQDEKVKVWDVQTGEERLNMEGHTTPVNTCAISPKGNYIVSGGQNGQLKMWDVHAKSIRLADYWHKVNGCAISPDGKWVVSAQEDEVLKVWDTQTATSLLTLEGHAGPVYACAICPQGNFIVSASDDNTLNVWDAHTGEELGTLQGHTERVYSCAVSLQGDWIVSASDDKTLIVWDRKTGYDYRTLRGHEDIVNDCAISSQGDWVVSASGDKTLKIWDIRTGSELRTLIGHTGWVHSCRISPQNDWIVSASTDKTLKIWDVQTGGEKKTLQGHTGTVSACAISPDGSHIVSVAYDGTVKVWNVSSGQCLATLVVERNLRTCAFCPDGQYIIAGGYSGLYFLQLVL